MLARDRSPTIRVQFCLCVFAFLGSRAQRRSAFAPEREQLVDQYARWAVELLSKARTTGFFTPDLVIILKMDTTLDALRSRDDFRNWWKNWSRNEKQGKVTLRLCPRS